MTDTATDELLIQEQYLGINDLVPCPANPRKHFPTAAHKSLVKSIKKHGIRTRLLVMPHPDEDGRFMIIAGERRFRAAQDAKLSAIPCSILKVTDALEFLELQADENLDRVNLNPLEEAETYKLLMGAGKTQVAIADKYQISQSQISNRLRLLKLPKTWQKKLINGTVPVTFGRDLAGWIKWPQVFAALDRAVDRIKGNLPTGGIMELSDYRAALADAIHEVGEPYYKIIPLGEGAALQKELEVVTIPADLGGRQVIMNTERLTELLQEREWEAEEDQSEPPTAEGLPADQAATATPPHVPHENLFYDDADVGPGIPKEEPVKLTMAAMQANAEHAQQVADRNKANREAAQGPPVDYYDYWREWVRREAEGRLNDVCFLARVSRTPQFWNTWKPDETFLKLHTRDQLLAMSREWGLDMSRLEGYKTASQTMIDEILILTTQQRMGFGDEPAHHIGPPLNLIEQGWDQIQKPGEVSA